MTDQAASTYAHLALLVLYTFAGGLKAADHLLTCRFKSRYFDRSAAGTVLGVAGLESCEGEAYSIADIQEIRMALEVKSAELAA
jgi:DNA-binding FadR family transcriptional regulator